MLSASHNAMPDNGIKFLARGGVKLDDAIEAAIEKRMREPWDRPTGAGVGRVRPFDAAVEQYVDHLVSTIGGRLGVEGSTARPRSSSTAPTGPPPRRVRWRCARRAPR